MTKCFSDAADALAEDGISIMVILDLFQQLLKGKPFGRYAFYIFLLGPRLLESSGCQRFLIWDLRSFGILLH